MGGQCAERAHVGWVMFQSVDNVVVVVVRLLVVVDPHVFHGQHKQHVAV